MNYPDIFGDKRARTISTRFLLPMLAEENEHFIDYGLTENFNPENRSKTRFVNCFIGSVDRPQYDEHIFVVYHIKDVDNMHMQIMFKMREKDNFYTSYTFIDDGDTYAIYVFTIPQKWKKEYGYIKNGKYSECSRDFMKMVLKFWKLSDTSFTRCVFDKSSVIGEFVFPEAVIQPNGEVLPPPGILDLIPEEIFDDIEVDDDYSEEE